MTPEGSELEFPERAAVVAGEAATQRIARVRCGGLEMAKRRWATRTNPLGGRRADRTEAVEPVECWRPQKLNRERENPGLSARSQLRPFVDAH